MFLTFNWVENSIFLDSMFDCIRIETIHVKSFGKVKKKPVIYFTDSMGREFWGFFKSNDEAINFYYSFEAYFRNANCHNVKIEGLFILFKDYQNMKDLTQYAIDKLKETRKIIEPDN